MNKTTTILILCLILGMNTTAQADLFGFLDKEKAEVPEIKHNNYYECLLYEMKGHGEHMLRIAEKLCEIRYPWLKEVSKNYYDFSWGQDGYDLRLKYEGVTVDHRYIEYDYYPVKVEYGLSTKKCGTNKKDDFVPMIFFFDVGEKASNLTMDYVYYDEEKQKQGYSIKPDGFTDYKCGRLLNVWGHRIK